MTTGSDGRQLLLSILVDEADAAAKLDDFNQRIQTAQSSITTFQQTAGQPPQLDLSALQSQIDQLSSQFGDLNAAAELNTESLTNFGATTETTTEQVAALGNASEEGATHTRSHGQAAGEAESEFSAFGEALGAVANIIPGLNGGLSQGGSLLSAFSQEAEEGQSHLALVGAGVAAIGVGIAGLSFEAFDHGVESIHLLSEETGMSTEAVGGFQLSLQEAGLSGDAANSSLMRVQMNLQSMINQLDQGKAPTGNFAIALSQIGISADDVQKSGGNLNTLMPEIADAFQRAKAQADASGTSFNATGLAMQIFGRSGAAMVPILEQGSAALQANADYVKSLGLANEEEVTHLEAWNTASSRAQLAAEAFGASIGSDLAPMMTSAATLVGNATAAFDQLPGPIKDATVTLPLLAGAGLSAAAGVGKLFDLMGSGVDTIRSTISTVSSAAQATVAWATSLDAEAVSAGTAATAETGLATAEGAAGAGAVGAGAAATAMDAQGASAPGVEAAAVAEEHLATAEGLAGAGGVTAGAGATAGATGVSGFLAQLGAALGPIGVFTALVGGGVAIEAKFKDQIDAAVGSMGEYIGGAGLMSAGINGLVDHLNGGASPALDQLSDHLSTGKGGFDAITASTNANATATDADTQELKKLDSALGLTGADAQAALPFLQQFIMYEDQVGGDALQAAKGVDTLSNSLNSMSAVLNEHLSTGATGEAGFATLDKQIDNTTKVLVEEKKAAADAAQGNTALSQAEYALADAYRAGDAVAIAKANQTIALLPPTKDLTDATLAGIAAQKDDAAGKTASAEAERVLQAAYESGDPARVKMAEDNLKIAQAEDGVTTASGKADAAALKEGDSYQSLSDALTKAGTAADQLNTKYNDLITGAFLKSHDVSQQQIADEQAKGDAAYNNAQKAYAAWSGFDSAYQSDLANERAAVAVNDKAGADYWKNQAADAKTSADDQKTALTGFITEAEKDLGQAHTDSQTLWKDMDTAARNSVADQLAAFTDLFSVAKSSIDQIPAEYRGNLASAQSSVQSFYGQLTSLDQSYSAGTSGLTQQEYQDKRQSLQNQLSDAKNTYAQELQAAKDLGSAQLALMQAETSQKAQQLYIQDLAAEDSARNQENIALESINNQIAVNTAGRNKDAAQQNAILSQEAAAVKYYMDQQNIALVNEHEDEEQIALNNQQIAENQAKEKEVLAQLEMTVATETAKVQIAAAQLVADKQTTINQDHITQTQAVADNDVTVGQAVTDARNQQSQDIEDYYSTTSSQMVGTTHDAANMITDYMTSANQAITTSSDNSTNTQTGNMNIITVGAQATGTAVATDMTTAFGAVSAASDGSTADVLNNGQKVINQATANATAILTGLEATNAGLLQQNNTLQTNDAGWKAYGAAAGDGLAQVRQSGSDALNVLNALTSAASKAATSNAALGQSALSAAGEISQETSALGGLLSTANAFGAGGSSSSGGGSSSSGGMGIGTTSIGAAFGSGSGGSSSSSSGGSSGGGGGGGGPYSLFDLGYPITLGYAFDSDYAAGLLSPTGGYGPALSYLNGASGGATIGGLENALIGAQLSGQTATAASLEAQLEALGVTMAQILTFLQSNGLTVNVGNAPALATAISSGATQQQVLRPV